MGANNRLAGLGLLCSLALACDPASDDTAPEAVDMTSGGTGSTPKAPGGSDGESGGGSSGESSGPPAAETTAADGGSTEGGESGIDDSESDGGSSGGAMSLPSLLWLLDAETGLIQPPAEAHDGADASVGNCGDDSIAYVMGGDQPVHSGAASLAVRFDRAWLDDNPDCGAVRAFFVQSDVVQIEPDAEYWHGWAVYVPDEPGDTWTVARWATEGQSNKALSLDLRSDLTWRFKSTQIGSNGSFDLTLTPATVDFGAGAADTWHEFAANFVMTTDEDAGFFRIWHRVQGDEDWTLVVDSVGRTANFDAPFPFAVRHGLHSGHGWGDDNSDSRVFYFDEVRFGTVDAGFEGVAPGALSTPQ